MEIQILPLVLILTGALVVSRLIAARSPAVSAPLRRDTASADVSAVSPHFPQRREASRGGHRPPRSLFNAPRSDAGREPARGCLP